MPVPQPREGESQDEFVSRCISNVTHSDPNRKPEQVQAICFTTWRKRKMITEFARLLRYLQMIYGEEDGTIYYNDWLNDVGFDDTKPLVFQKNKMFVLARRLSDVKQEALKKVQAQLALEIVDPKNHVVAGYASTPIEDCDKDRQTIEAIHRAGKEYMDTGEVVFAFHRNIPAGEILNEYTAPGGKVYRTRFDKVGWYVVSRPTKKYWDLIEKGELNGYSVGWRNWRYCPDDPNLVVRVEYDDLSYVPFSCNHLSFFGRAKANMGFCPTSPSSSKDAMQPQVGQNMKKTNDNAKQMTAEQRERISTSQFACPSERKLPIHDAAHTRNAMARYNQAEGCQTAEVKSRICRAARKFGIDSAFEKGGFCYTGGKNMTDNELEVAKTKLLEKFPDAEEQIKAVDTIESLKELEAKLTKEPPKEKSAVEVFKELLDKRDKLTQERMLKQMVKTVAEEEEKIKILDTEDRFEKFWRELGVVKAKQDEILQALGKLDAFELRLTKMEDDTDVKGHGLEGDKEIEEPSIIEKAMMLDDKQDPMALNKLATKMSERPKDVEGEENE